MPHPLAQLPAGVFPCENLPMTTMTPISKTIHIHVRIRLFNTYLSAKLLGELDAVVL